MQLVRVQCPSCSATLPPRAPCGTITCDYCGAVFESDQIRHAQDQQGQALSTDQLAQAIVQAQQELQQQQQQRQVQQQQLQAQHMARIHGVQVTSQTATKAAKSAAWLAIVPLVLVLGISGVISMVVLRQVDQATGAVENAFGGGGGGGTDANSNISWDPNGTPPIIGKVKGKDAIIGRMRATGGSDLLSIDAYDMEGNRLWRISDLDTYANAYQAVRVGAVGEHVVVSDGKSRIRVFDRDSAQHQHTVELSDNVKRMCIPMFAYVGMEVERPNEIWFEQIDERKFYLDPKTGKLEDSDQKPDWCINDMDRRFMAGRGDDPLAVAPTVDGVNIKRAHIDGDLGVAMGIKTPGTQVPRAVGFDPETREITWDIVVSQVQKGSLRTNSTDHSGLAGGRFAATYGEGQDKWHLAAFDATNGTLLWDETLRGIFAVDWLQGFAMTEDYVIVVRMSSVEVRDAKTGKLEVVVGHDTYDDEF